MREGRAEGRRVGGGGWEGLEGGRPASPLGSSFWDLDSGTSGVGGAAQVHQAVGVWSGIGSAAVLRTVPGTGVAELYSSPPTASAGAFVSADSA